ncbi:hypothetical protein BV20DRAFT_509668 [Pilatotrama ljubarskyi]|nr:hypothetical protein BV20DRAFT_509668 [Pilatotrama ljubarskyi]
MSTLSGECSAESALCPPVPFRQEAGTTVDMLYWWALCSETDHPDELTFFRFHGVDDRRLGRGPRRKRTFSPGWMLRVLREASSNEDIRLRNVCGDIHNIYLLHPRSIGPSEVAGAWCVRKSPLTWHSRVVRIRSFRWFGFATARTISMLADGTAVTVDRYDFKAVPVENAGQTDTGYTARRSDGWTSKSRFRYRGASG